MEKKAVDQTFKYLLNMISQGTWPIGKRLPSEKQLALKCCVSRNTLRAAIQRLNIYGIVETRHGSGSYVARTVMEQEAISKFGYTLLSTREIVELLEFRLLVEPECALLAAQRHTDQDLMEIKALADELCSSVDNVDQYVNADIEFHLAVAKASKHSLFLNIMMSIKQPLINHFYEMGRRIGPRFSAKDHYMIYKAIAHGEDIYAKLLLSRNIERSLNLIKEYYNKEASP